MTGLVGSRGPIHADTYFRLKLIDCGPKWRHAETMADKAALVTRWGGTPSPAHDRLIVKPPNSTSDLVLTSEVIEQSFFSLQRHEYHYKADNLFGAGGAYCLMNVKWDGPKIRFDRLAPGPNVKTDKSFFSAQTLRTTANAEVIAGATPVTARSALAERADAYVPWVQAIAGPVMKAVVALVKTGVPAATAASLVLSSGEKLFIISQLSWSEDLYTYAITFKNESAGPLHVTVAGVRYNNYAIDLYLEPGEDASYEFQTVDGPEEREAMVTIANICEFPVRVLATDSMMELSETEAEASLGAGQTKRELAEID